MQARQIKENTVCLFYLSHFISLHRPLREFSISLSIYALVFLGLFIKFSICSFVPMCLQDVWSAGFSSESFGRLPFKDHANLWSYCATAMRSIYLTMIYTNARKKTYTNTSTRRRKMVWSVTERRMAYPFPTQGDPNRRLVRYHMCKTSFQAGEMRNCRE